MGIAYAWEKMSLALDALAVAPEALPLRLRHALFPYVLNALHDAEQVEYLPAELLDSLRRIREQVGDGPESLSTMRQDEAVTLATEIVRIAHEIRRRSTF